MVRNVGPRAHYADHLRRVLALDDGRVAGDKGELPQLSQTACWLGCLLLALAVHELGHAMTAAWLDCDQGEVNIWPLGSLVGPSFAPRSSENFLVAMAGLVTNGAIVLAIALGLNLFAGAQFAWNPFGNEIIDQQRHDSRCRCSPPSGRYARSSLERRLDHRLVRLLELGPSWSPT